MTARSYREHGLDEFDEDDFEDDNLDDEDDDEESPECPECGAPVGMEGQWCPQCTFWANGSAP